LAGTPGSACAVCYDSILVFRQSKATGAGGCYVARPKTRELVIPHILKIVGLVVFAQTLFTRAVDPVIPMIALDLAIGMQTAALLSTAFTFPYALVQPVLGVTGDFLGKTRVMNACVFVVAISSLVCAFADSFSLLVAMRVVAGLVAGGVFPVAMALIGDLVPIEQRQVAIARLLGIALTANVLGASIAGVIGDLFGWRGVFLILGLFALGAAIIAFFVMRRLEAPPPQRFNRAAVVANFRSIFADPRAKVCFSAVFLEAVFIHGLFPFVGLLLFGIGETRASIAGLLIACFAIGGVVYSLVLPYVIGRVAERWLMLTGGTIAAAALALIAMHFAWQVQIVIFLVFGLGFYLLHGCIQLHVTDLSHTARGAAASLHSSSFYLGQAVGPIVYGAGFTQGYPDATLFAGVLVLLGVGAMCARLLPVGRRT
jgi:predicted MFS family arabinose efflux permease